MGMGKEMFAIGPVKRRRHWSRHHHNVLDGGRGRNPQDMMGALAQSAIRMARAIDVEVG